MKNYYITKETGTGEFTEPIRRSFWDGERWNSEADKAIIIKRHNQAHNLVKTLSFAYTGVRLIEHDTKTGQEITYA